MTTTLHLLAALATGAAAGLICEHVRIKRMAGRDLTDESIAAFIEDTWRRPA